MECFISFFILGKMWVMVLCHFFGVFSLAGQKISVLIPLTLFFVIIWWLYTTTKNTEAQPLTSAVVTALNNPLMSVSPVDENICRFCEKIPGLLTVLISWEKLPCKTIFGDHFTCVLNFFSKSLACFKNKWTKLCKRTRKPNKNKTMFPRFPLLFARARHIFMEIDIFGSSSGRVKYGSDPARSSGKSCTRTEHWKWLK